MSLFKIKNGVSAFIFPSKQEIGTFGYFLKMQDLTMKFLILSVVLFLIGMFLKTKTLSSTFSTLGAISLGISLYCAIRSLQKPEAEY